MKKIFVMAIIVCLSAGLFLLTGCGDANKKCPGCGSVLVNNICPNICKVCKTGHVTDGKCPVCNKTVAPSDSSKGGDGSTPPPPVPLKPIEKKPVPSSAVKRVTSRILKGEFGLTGHGEDKNWGIAKSANFKYTVIVVADSKIQKKETLDGGEIKVTEIRTFKKVQDSIVASEVDLKLSLDTLPISAFSTAIDAAVTLWTSLTGNAVTGGLVLAGKNYVRNKLKSIDGTSCRKLLGSVGIAPSQEAEQMISKLASAQILKALGGIRSISGKSYKISYYQKQSGEPMYITFTYDNGDPVTDEEEKMVLKRVNTFIDYNMVPNKDCMPGDSWKIHANDIQEVFDPYAEGTYTGMISATRKANTPQGDWNIKLQPSVINIINHTGNTTGYLRLQNGYAHVNPTSLNLNDLFVEGNAKLQKLSRHHWLFTAKINGECTFQGKFVTVEQKD